MTCRTNGLPFMMSAQCSSPFKAFLAVSLTQHSWISLTLLSEPNNDSPLNGAAAGMWDDQVKYKEYLHKHYEQEVTNKK